MNDIVLSLLRTLVPAGVSYLVGRGWLSASSAGEVAAAILTLVAAGWGASTHTESAKIAAADALPDVKKIIVSADAPRASAAGIAALDPERPKVQVEKDTGVRGRG